MVKRVIVSACLMGKRCRYNGEHRFSCHVFKAVQKLKVYALCPEELGGLKGIRGPFELTSSAEKIISQKGKVIDIKGKDFTKPFILGAERLLEFALKYNIRLAILKARSPSCSPKGIYSGKFDRRLLPGQGIAAYLLKKNNIIVFSEEDFNNPEEFYNLINKKLANNESN